MMSQLFTGLPLHRPPHRGGTRTTPTGTTGSHLQSVKLPQQEAPLTRSLAASSTGHVGKCLQWFPSKSGSLGSTTFAATGEPRQVALGWVRLAAARWPSFSFPPVQDSSKGLDSCVCACVRERSRDKKGFCAANEMTPASGSQRQTCLPELDPPGGQAVWLPTAWRAEKPAENSGLSHIQCALAFQGCNHGRLV